MPLCYNEAEIQEHIFLNRHPAKRVWFAPPLGFHIPIYVDLKLWMLNLFNNRDQRCTQVVCATHEDVERKEPTDIPKQIVQPI